MKLLTITALVAIFPTMSTAPKTPKPKEHPVAKTYSDRYFAAKQKLGARAPGRNIRRHGVRTKNGTRQATIADLAASSKRLKVMITTPKVAPIARVAQPAQAQPATSGGGGAGGDLASIRQCESGGNYATNTGNGYYGAYQFDASTWKAAGGTGMPHTASPAEQDRVAANWIAKGNRGAWPNC